MNKKLKKINFKRGMTLFISIVIMSLLLLLSFAAADIAVKGSLFATSGRDSQYAFFAANAGLECAIYWDSQPLSGSAFSTTTSSTITCSEQTIATGSQSPIPGTTLTSLIGGGGYINPTSVFGFNLNQGINPVPHCVVVYVTKNSDGTTYIQARGYNTCDTSNPRRVERGVEVTY
jgi:hypothetical protein